VDFGPLRLTRRTSRQNSIGARVSQFEQLPPRPGQFVFLGDSGIEAGMWHEWFPALSCVNRGVGDDTVSGVRHRLDSAVRQPRAVTLLIGTNDLTGVRWSRKVPGIAEELRRLITDIQSRAPEAVLLLNSVHPCSRKMSDTIRSLNDRYRQIAAETGTTYVDLWGVLAAADGSLQTDLTFDGRHLNGLGYRNWVEVLRPHIEALGKVQVKAE
jgi:lysophospholipase L1-like esterase